MRSSDEVRFGSRSFCSTCPSSRHQLVVYAEPVSNWPRLIKSLVKWDKPLILRAAVAYCKLTTHNISVREHCSTDYNWLFSSLTMTLTADWGRPAYARNRLVAKDTNIMCPFHPQMSIDSHHEEIKSFYSAFFIQSFHRLLQSNVHVVSQVA